MKKIVILCITAVLILTGCDPPIVCREPYRVSSFDRSQKPDPMFITVEVENNTSKDRKVVVTPFVACLNYKDLESTELIFDSYYTGSDFFQGIYKGYQQEKSATIGAGEIFAFEKMYLMGDYQSVLMGRVICPWISYPSEEDKITMYPGATDLFLQVQEVLSNYVSSNLCLYEYKMLEGRNLREITVDDLKNVGGDFYYIQDPAKSGTKEYGQLVCPSNPEINGLPSGHVKARFTLTEEPDTGRIKINFISMELVTEEEQQSQP